MKHRQWAACLLAGLVLWMGAPPAEARRDDRRDDRYERSTRHDDGKDDHAPRREETRRDGMSLDEAVARVQRETGGRVLAAETRGDTHRIKVLMPNGAVRVIHVDARGRY